MLLCIGKVYNMYGYIYKTTNLINGKIYIGKRKGKFTLKYLGSGVFIKQSIKKYGKKQFLVKVLEYAETSAILSKLEKKYISEFRQILPKNKLYNISDGGGGTDGTKWMFNSFTLEKRCIKINNVDSYLQKGWELGCNRYGENNPMYGKGCLVSGKNNGMYGKRGKDSQFFGKTLSEKHKSKLRGKRVEREIRECACGCGYKKECRLTERWSYKRGHHIKGSNNPSVTHPDSFKNRNYLYGKDHPFFEKHHSEEAKQKISDSIKKGFKNGRMAWNKAKSV